MTSSDDGTGNQSLQEQTLDIKTDMLERFSTIEQARNMDLFQQLQAWQAEQREQLMRQQQQQLLRLQAEQRAAESRLLVQRQNCWSSSKNLPAPAAVEGLAQKSPVKKVQVGLPQAIATSTLALARLRLQESLMVSSDPAAQTADEDSEHPVSDGFRTSTPPGEEQNNAYLPGYSASYELVVSDDLCPLPDSISDAVSHSQFWLPDTRHNAEVSCGVQSALTSIPNIALKPDTGMSVSEYDELPVCGSAARGRSFEELLSEQLEKDQQLFELQQCHADSIVQEPKRNRSFLRKGDGTARFKNSQRQFPKCKVTEDCRNSKQSESSETRIQPSGPLRSAPLAVLPPMSRKSCLKKTAVKNGNTQNSASGLDFITDNVACTRTPVTSTPDRKRLQTATHNASSSGHDSIGDASYIACMQTRAKKEEAEVEELHIFELLEDYVDDNASFTSNMSTISQILARHDVRQPTEFYDGQQNSSTLVTYSSENKEGSNADVQKVEDYTDEESIDSDADSDDDVNSTLVDDTLVVSVAKPDAASVENTAQPASLQTIYRKISSMGGKGFVNEMQPVGDIRQRLLSNGNEHAVLHLQSGLIGTVTEKSATQQLRHESIQANDHMEYAAIQKQARDSGVLGNTGTVTKNIFLDEREWNDSVVSSPVYANNDLHRNRQQNSSSPDYVVSAASSVEQLSAETGYHTADAQTDSPPTSKLAQKLFPKLKPHKSKTSEIRSSSQTDVLPVSSEASNPAPDVTDSASMLASAALREKLAQLEAEIQHFRSENAVLATLRQEQQQVVDRLKKEMAEFECQKADELQRLEEFKAEETKKLKKERKVFETYQKAARAGPDKKDREEIEMLKSQVNELQDEIKCKERKWIASNQRLRDRVEQLEQENAELQEEIRVLEQRRLQEWKPHRKELEPSAKSDTKPVESAVEGKNVAPRCAQKPPEKSQKQTERQKHIPSTKKPEPTSKLPVRSSGYSDPSSQMKLSLDINDNMLQQRNNVPKPQTISPMPASISADDVYTTSLAAVRKTAPKSGAIQSTHMSDRPYDQVQHPDGKVERVCPDGSREILFTNGTRKQISADGQTIIVSFFNGDIKQMLPDGRVVYYYADAQTTHTTYADGLQIFQFANGQVEKHYVDGTKEIQFPDQTIKYLFANGSAESVFLDGTVVHVEGNGNKQITFPNGQKEVHSASFKKREYPDGTTKTVFTDGRQETRYSNGRVRVKDASGILILDQLT